MTCWRMEGSDWEAPESTGGSEPFIEPASTTADAAAAASASAAAAMPLEQEHHERGGAAIRSEGGDIVFEKSDQGMENFLDTMLQGLINESKSFTSASAASQRYAASMILKGKEKLLESMKKKLEGVSVVTADHVRSIIEDFNEDWDEAKREVMEKGGYVSK